MYKYPQLHQKKWLKNQIKNTPLRKIAKELGCSYSAVVYVANKFKLRIPKRRTLDVTVDKSDISKKAYKKKWPKGRRGEKAANWQGGKRRGGSGYVYIFKPKHPNATKAGYVMEHRLVLEESLGRFLKKEEVVHHINGNKQDNKIQNLELYASRSKHFRTHKKINGEFKKLRLEVKRLKGLLDLNNITY